MKKFIKFKRSQKRNGKLNPLRKKLVYAEQTLSRLQRTFVLPPRDDDDDYAYLEYCEYVEILESDIAETEEKIRDLKKRLGYK